VRSQGIAPGNLILFNLTRHRWSPIRQKQRHSKKYITSQIRISSPQIKSEKELLYIYIYIYIKRAAIFISLYKSQYCNYHNPHTINENPPPFLINNISLHRQSGPGSSVGIATGYGGSGDRISVGVRFSVPLQTGPGTHSASCTMGTVSFLGVKSGWSVTLTTHPLLVLCSIKSRAIPILPLLAVRPVQSLSACTV